MEHTTTEVKLRYCVPWRVLVIMLCLTGESAVGQPGPASLGNANWDAPGSYRLWLTVPPRELAGRDFDMQPARIQLDFDAVLEDLGVSGRMIPTAIHIIQYNAQSGQPILYPDYRADAPFDVPFRFDNANLRGYSWMYNLLSDSSRGELVWVHRQQNDQPSHYAVHFHVAYADDVLGQSQAVPRPLLGDVDVLYQRSGGPLSGMYHSRPALGDWDGDGLVDLMVGNILGHIFFHKNVGTPGKPIFGTGRLLHAQAEEAAPAPPVIDVGWYAAPDLVDWDEDGDLELIVGADGGKVFRFENVGTPTAPALVDRGRLTARSSPDAPPMPVLSPHAPCPELPFYRQDYVPVPDVVDWDCDGDFDLLLGGYVTGRVFFYENIKDAPGPPDLVDRGVIEADGGPLDVLWGAAPCAADFDADGDLDLLVGTLDQRVHESQAHPWPSFFYFENVGDRSHSKLAARPFPLAENIGTLTVPRVLDWDADRDLDLVVGIGHEVRILRNIGTNTQMRFEAEAALTVPWTPRITAGFAVPPVDWDGDGDVDLIYSGGRSATFVENVDPANPPQFVLRGPVTAGGEIIDHEFTLGDDHSFADAFDWDTDGDLDYLLGNSMGHVWYYENAGTAQRWHLLPGRQFRLATGEPLLVGQAEDTALTDFATHSGNRSDPAPGDFDGDGDHDLIVSDAYGNVTYFENTGSNADPLFAAGHVIFTREGRCVICAVDWDKDGLLDLIASWTGEGVWLCANNGTRETPQFEKTRRFDLPWIPYPHPYALDWNRDGDLDLVFASSYAFLYFAERTFLDVGYARGQLVRVETK